MANTLSAKKRIRKTARQTSRNKFWKKRIHSSLKDIKNFLSLGKKEEAQKSYLIFQKLVDRAAAKKVIHKNKASRLKSRMVKKLSAS